MVIVYKHDGFGEKWIQRGMILGLTGGWGRLRPLEACFPSGSVEGTLLCCFDCGLYVEQYNYAYHVWICSSSMVLQPYWKDCNIESNQGPYGMR